MSFSTYYRTYVFLLMAFTLSALISCEKSDSISSVNSEQLKSRFKTYEQNGLAIHHPTDWSFLHDERGIIADRTIAFETEGTSRVTVYFYKSSPRSYEDLADNLSQQLDLEDSKNIKNYQRETIEIGNFKGLKLSWKSSGFGETLNEVTILQIRKSPIPVFVQFQLFDDDIKTQSYSILPFSEGITFDPQGIKL